MIPFPAQIACPASTPDSAVHVTVVSTGSIGTDWKRVEDSGLTGPVRLPLLVGLIETPKGTVLVDAGLGETSRDGRFPGFPYRSWDLEVPEGAAIVERLDSPPLAVLMTHLHWDHVGGLLDLSGTTLWAPEDELRKYVGGGLGFPTRWVTMLNDIHPVSFAPGDASMVLGKPAVDVLGDGSIWYLETPGHTPGSAAVLVAADDGPWLFIGDTAWVWSHLENTRRPWAVAMLDDAEPRELRKSLAWARWLHASCPDLHIVPGHEPGYLDIKPATATPGSPALDAAPAAAPPP